MDKQSIEDMISPGDMPLLEMMTNSVDNIGLAVETFADRNCSDMTDAVITTLIAKFFGRINPDLQIIPVKDLMATMIAIRQYINEVIDEYANKEEEE